VTGQERCQVFAGDDPAGPDLSVAEAAASYMASATPENLLIPGA
jgi:hypothetical protein